MTQAAGGAGAPRAAAESLWQVASPSPDPLTATAPRRCEVLIVGGGITGVSLLHRFCARRADAHLVESDRLASGASGRNAGFVLAGLADSYAATARTLGRSLAADVWSFTTDSGEMLAEILGGRGGHRRQGSWRLATSATEADELEESATLLREDGFDVAFTRRLEGSLSGFDAGLLASGDAEVDPVATVRAMAAGDAARITEHTAVSVLQAAPSGVVVGIEDAECRADVVILATNAGTSRLVPGIDIRPIRGQMLATKPVSVRITERPVYADHGYRYWRQLDDGRLLVGGCRHLAIDEEATDRAEPSETVQRHLDGQLQRLGVRVAVTHRWGGIMGFTPDCLPLVGVVPHHPGVYVCGGYSGHGMGFAVNAARTLADHILDGAAIPHWMSTQRLATRTPAA